MRKIRPFQLDGIEYGAHPEQQTSIVLIRINRAGVMVPNLFGISGTVQGKQNIVTGESNYMKRYAILAALALCFAMIVPRASAQDDKNHGNIGVFFDYTRLSSTTNLNMFGVGGRIGVNVAKHIVLEGEMAYDFEKTFTTGISSSGLTNASRSNLRLLHGLFGPKLQTTGPVRIFATVKGGFVNFGVGGPVTIGTINNQFNNIVDGDTDAAVYPAGGIEFNIGWLGIRGEVGDEIIFFPDKARNNFRGTIGPQIRF
jgi:hypothetical protein